MILKNIEIIHNLFNLYLEDFKKRREKSGYEIY